MVSTLSEWTGALLTVALIGVAVAASLNGSI